MSSPQRPVNPAEVLLRHMPARLQLLARPAIDLPHDAHWDGRFFHNPGIHVHHGVKEALRWLRTRQPACWPTWVENGPASIPPAVLSNQLDDWQVTFINHATVLLQIGPWNLLTDPVWSDRVSPLRQMGPRRVRHPGLRLDELPPIHAVLLSHDHYDHLDLRTLIWLARHHDPLVVTGLGNAALLRGHGVRCEELDWWQSVSLGPLGLHFVPAQHFSGRGARDRNRTLWGGLMVTSSAGNLFFAGDTGFGPHFIEIRERLGAPRLALLPIGAYEPRWFMGPVHMNPDDAVRAHVDLQAHQSLAIHFNTFQLTDEDIGQPVRDLQQALIVHGVPVAQFAVLDEGRALRL